MLEILRAKRILSVAELTDKEIAYEKEFLKGLPRINIGALFLPPVWGSAHGIWPTILFYPVWLFADNVFYAAFVQRTPLALAIASVVFVTLVAGTIAFSLVSQPLAAHRAEQRGIERKEYLRRERMWAVLCVVVGIVMIVLATYYNLFIRSAGEG